MMKLIILILTIIVFGKEYQPNVINIFEAIPNKYLDDLSLKDRRHIIQSGEWSIGDRQYNAEFDLNTGMLKMQQSFNDEVNIFQKWQLRTWQLKDKVLVCLSIVGGTEQEFQQNEFKFFEYKDKQLTEVTTGYMKAYSNNFDLFMASIVKQFCDFSTDKKVLEKLRYSGLIFDLFEPNNGISVFFADEQKLKAHPRLRLNYKSKVYEFIDENFQ